ncbi:hypothetical protein PSTG_02085 [Puccinia striiformis f. sp. tritici PST-78]|uniref:Reverse transcriptase domain-containing protein n=1 Tax=Puccinia striiformis f. sp. tritici PST-78 TaxID=1165861 RepID=A0A0L0VZB8_9BASI|nr:hypothetical protein PSTG_02085 [Puccinia striiformis f. sp. tritici PST-78]
MLHEFDTLAIFRWVDDNLFVKRADSTLQMKDVVQRLDQLCVKTNTEKFSEFLTEQKYVGFVWDGNKKTVKLPDKKLAKRIEQIKAFLLVGAKFKYDKTELRCYLNSIYRWMSEWMDHFATRTISPDVREDLTVWLTTLKEFAPMQLIPNPDPTDIGWVGDVSTSYGIGVLIGRKWAQFCLNSEARIHADLTEDQEQEQISRLETVAIRLGLLILLKIGVDGCKTFIVWTDNTTTENAVQKRRSKDRFVNDEWKIVQKILIAEQLEIFTKRVSSKDRADALLRGNSHEHSERDRIRIVLPEDLETL